MRANSKTSLTVKRPTVDRLKPLLGRFGVSYDDVRNSLLDEHDTLHLKRAPEPREAVPA